MNNKRLIAKIFNGNQLIMTIDRNMLSCEFGALDRGNLTDVVNWGIYANRGSISFIDNIGYFNSQNVNSTDIKKCLVKFYLAKNQETLIATFKVDNVDFDDETRKVEIQLVGKVIELQNKPSTLTGKDVFTFNVKSAKFLSGLGNSDFDIEKDLPENYNEYYPSYGLTIGENAELLEHIFVFCPYLTFGNFWDKTTKICQATMCRVIEDEDGNAIIAGERPTRTPTIVNPKNILSISKGDFVKLSNPYIDATERIKYTNRIYDQAHKTFTVDYDSYGDPLSISGGNYNLSGSDGEYYADISFEVTLPQKTYKISFLDTKKSLSKRNLSGEDKGSFVEKETYDENILVSKNIFWFEDSFTIVESEVIDGEGIRTRLNTLDFSFYLDYFEDEGQQTSHIITDESEKDDTLINSNDLIQANNYYYGLFNGEPDETVDHSFFILEEVARRYANGRECFEIECLFNDYYDENGNKVFSKDDLSAHFNKYDVIIPYVNKKGQTVPLRVNEDGTPKKFRIIGISYSYDGLLKQKLSVQEERYDVD